MSKRPGYPDGPEFVITRLGKLQVAAQRMMTDVASAVEEYATLAAHTLASGGRLLYCGNGGSASTVEHVAAEYQVRFRRDDRRPLPAVALGAGSAVLTASANDFGFEKVFVRPLRALGGAGDLLVIHSTSGRSANCIEAAKVATELRMETVALTGADGGELADLASLAIRVPADETATVQELHLAVEHAVVDYVDIYFADGES